MHLGTLDYLVIGIYFVFVLTIGVLLKRRVRSSSDFLLAGRAIPLWISSLSFISANLGAQEVLGMAASGAKYGIMTAHFYWIGAIPAMVFLGLFMMPFYYGSRARSVPEYLKLRFDEKTRGLNAVSFATMTVFSSGVSLYALALLFKVLLGWPFDLSVWVAAAIVTAYTLTGGLTSALYNEVLQFFLIVLGVAPLVAVGLVHAGGMQGLAARLPAAMMHLTPRGGDNPMGVSLFGLCMGLGFVLSFGYWCTDFLVVQRAMVSRSMREARLTPLVAALPKLLLPFLVILPGLIAVALAGRGGFALPLKDDGRTDFDLALPTLLSYYYPSGLLGVGLTALIASFMSGMAGNVTAFNSVFTYDIYQAYLRKDQSDAHYLRVGKAATLVGVLISIGTAYLARTFNNIMDLLQLVFGFVNAPLFATFLLGMGWRRATGHGAFFGLLGGTLLAAATHGLSVAEGKGGWIHPAYSFPSGMSQAFAVAIVAFCGCFALTVLISLVTRPRPAAELAGLVYQLPAADAGDESPAQPGRRVAWYGRPAVLAGIVLVVTTVLNVLFW